MNGAFFISKGKKMTITSYSVNDNTGIIDDAMLPSQVIGVFRMMLGDQRIQWNDAEWFEYLDGTPNASVSYVSGNQFRVTGNDASAHYHVGRRVKIVGSGAPIYGTITAVSYASNATTVTVDASLTNEPINVFTSILSNEADAIPRKAIQEIVGDMLSGNTTSAINVTYQESDGTIDFEVTAQATENNFSNADKSKLDGIATNANNYSHPTSAGNKHIPSGGSSNQLLRYSTSGTATWWTPNYVPNTGNSSIGGVKNFTNTTEASSTTNASVELAGGLGVAKKIRAGGDIHTAGGILATGDVTAFVGSDLNLKHSIENIEDPISKVQKLNGTSFYYNDPKSDREHGKQYGLIAQDVEKVFPEIIKKSEDGHLRIRQAGFELTALLIEAVKELSDRVKTLEEK